MILNQFSKRFWFNFHENRKRIKYSSSTFLGQPYRSPENPDLYTQTAGNYTPYAPTNLMPEKMISRRTFIQAQPKERGGTFPPPDWGWALYPIQNFQFWELFGMILSKIWLNFVQFSYHTPYGSFLRFLALDRRHVYFVLLEDLVQGPEGKFGALNKMSNAHQNRAFWHQNLFFLVAKFYFFVNANSRWTNAACTKLSIEHNIMMIRCWQVDQAARRPFGPRY